MTFPIYFPKRRSERGNTAAALASLNEVLLAKEWCIETDTGRAKLGDGVTAWNDLLYSVPGFIDLAGLADGDGLTWDDADSKWVAAAPASGDFTYLGSAVVTGSAATDLTLSGLDLAADGRYYIEVLIKNALGSTPLIYLRANSDGTDANYWRQIMFASGSTATAQRSNDAFVVAPGATQNSTLNGFVFNDNAGRPGWELAVREGEGSLIARRHVTVQWQTAANLTSLTIHSATANALDVGTIIRVWKVSP